MNDLISRKALLKDIKKFVKGTPLQEMFETIVDKQPTAYDVDKVVEKLEGLKHPYKTFSVGYGDLNAFDYYIEKAKEIMKGAVKDE